MQALYDSRSHDVTPNTKSFASIINSWVNIRYQSVPQKAERFVREIDLHNSDVAKGHRYSFGAVEYGAHLLMSETESRRDGRIFYQYIGTLDEMFRDAFVIDLHYSDVANSHRVSFVGCRIQR
jgi:hypothetical protein